MKKVGNLVIALIISVITTFSLISCENKELIENASDSEANTEGTKKIHSDVGLVQHSARSSSNEYTDWDEVESPQYLVLNRYNFSTDEASPLSPIDYKFEASLLVFGVGLLYPIPDVYVKTYSPTGRIAYHKMNRRGFDYYKYLSFDEDGTYYYRYFVKHNDYNILIKISESLNFNSIVSVPSYDDYKSNIEVFSYYDNNGELYYGDQFDFVLNNCTSWVALKVNQLWGTKRAFHNKMFGRSKKNILGHAVHWLEVFEEHKTKYNISKEPKRNCIAWWGDTKCTTPLGHVAFVHDVYSDGRIEISEYNWKRHKCSPSDYISSGPDKPYSHGTRIIRKGDEDYPEKFIYIPRP